MTLFISGPIGCKGCSSLASHPLAPFYIVHDPMTDEEPNAGSDAFYCESCIIQLLKSEWSAPGSVHIDSPVLRDKLKWLAIADGEQPHPDL